MDGVELRVTLCVVMLAVAGGDQQQVSSNKDTR